MLSCISFVVFMPMHLRSVKPDYTKEENPGSGALDLAMLFMTIWVPLRLTTALEASCNAFIFEMVISHLICQLYQIRLVIERGFNFKRH